MIWPFFLIAYALTLQSFLSEVTVNNIGNTSSYSKTADAPKEHLTLFLCGDVMTGRGIDQILPSSVEPELYEPYVKDARDYVKLAERVNGSVPKEVPYRYIWGDALEVWQSMAPDLKIINLETSITMFAKPWPGKQIHYRMHPNNTELLSTAGIDFCTLANNHILDWRRPGLLETLQSLKKADITYAGAGRDLEEARKPAVLKTDNGRVVVLAYGAETSGIPESWMATDTKGGVNMLPDLSSGTVDMIAKQVKAVKQPGDVVVFSVHWGSNWGYDVPPRQREFAHQLIDIAGVDVVHGHSSHHPMGLEVYKDKLIMYGAGDFINDYEGISGHEQYRDDLPLMYFPRIDSKTGKLLSMQMVPMQIKNLQLNHATPADAQWLADVLDRESRKFGTSVVLQDNGQLVLRW